MRDEIEGRGKTFGNVGKRGRWKKDERQEIWDMGKQIKRWEKKKKIKGG